MTAGNAFSRRAGFGSILAPILLLFTGCWLSGCWREGGDPVRPAGYLEIVARSNISIVTADKAAVFTIRAHNFSDDRIQWGLGSSSCQLDLVVDYDGEERTLITTRGCTDDIVPQALGPGDDRAETMMWSGEVNGSPAPFRLPAGEYDLWPVAGALRGEKPLHIEVRN